MKVKTGVKAGVMRLGRGGGQNDQGQNNNDQGSGIRKAQLKRPPAEKGRVA